MVGKASNCVLITLCKELNVKGRTFKCVLNGKVDQIILTGGIAYNKIVVDTLTERAGFIAPVTVYPGEDELLALVQGALRVMNGEEAVKEY